MRTDTEKSRYLSAVSGELADQQAWLKSYAHDDAQAYFVIEYQSVPIGTVRLYEPKGESFYWRSWILTKNRPNHAAIESSLMVYAYAVDHLGFQCAHFEVRKGNERVWQFHERFGAKRVSENELEFFYEINRSAIDHSRNHYKRFLPTSVTVEL